MQRKLNRSIYILYCFIIEYELPVSNKYHLNTLLMRNFPDACLYFYAHLTKRSMCNETKAR